MSLADVHVIVAEDEALGAAGNLGKNMGSGGTFYWFDVRLTSFLYFSILDDHSD